MTPAAMEVAEAAPGTTANEATTTLNAQNVNGSATCGRAPFRSATETDDGGRRVGERKWSGGSTETRTRVAARERRGSAGASREHARGRVRGTSKVRTAYLGQDVLDEPHLGRRVQHAHHEPEDENHEGYPSAPHRGRHRALLGGGARADGRRRRIARYRPRARPTLRLPRRHRRALSAPGASPECAVGRSRGLIKVQPLNCLLRGGWLSPRRDFTQKSAARALARVSAFANDGGRSSDALRPYQ